jgi:hypothetical protein
MIGGKIVKRMCFPSKPKLFSRRTIRVIRVLFFGKYKLAKKIKERHTKEFWKYCNDLSESHYKSMKEKYSSDNYELFLSFFNTNSISD